MRGIADFEGLGISIELPDRRPVFLVEERPHGPDRSRATTDACVAVPTRFESGMEELYLSYGPPLGYSSGGC